MPDTFCFKNTDAAKTLVKILNKRNDPYLNKKVSHLYIATVDYFNDIKDCKHKKFLLNFILHHQFKTIAGKDWDKEVKTYLRNVISSLHKEHIRK